MVNMPPLCKELEPYSVGISSRLERIMVGDLGPTSCLYNHPCQEPVEASAPGYKGQAQLTIVLKLTGEN
jgi:hypothetical protein